MKDKLLVVLKTVRKVLVRNLPLKIMSLGFAILLSSFVINANPSITSDKTFSGIEITTTGQTVLSGRSLALSTNVGEMTPVRVRVQVPRSSYTSVTADMVRVELDLSSIRLAGTQTVKLRGTSSTGRVIQIWPDSVELVVEDMDTRYAPVDVEFSGQDKDYYWYNLTRTNPTQIVLTGPTSIVQQVASARVTCDVTKKTSNFQRTESFVLLDGMDNEIDAALLTKSAGSVTISADVYPQKQLSISGNLDEILTGVLPEGYEIDSVVVQPESITVAGDAALLDGMRELTIKAIDITDKSHPFTEVRKIEMLDIFKNVSSDQVSVTVNVREKNITENFAEIPVSFLGKPEKKTVEGSPLRVAIQANGDYMDIKALKKGDLVASVDVSDLPEGTHELPIQVVAEDYPEVSFIADPATITVTITDSSM